MPILNNGVFNLTIPTQDLSKGLRPSKRVPRNSKFLVSCEGAVGLDNVLQVIDDLNLNRIDTSALVCSFPYPQLFVLTKIILVCTATRIYEYDGVNLTLRLTVTAGITWSVVDLYDYIYMSNGKVAVIRDSGGVWQVTTDLPIAGAICNYNGQIMIGAPGVEQV